MSHKYVTKPVPGYKCSAELYIIILEDVLFVMKRHIELFMNKTQRKCSISNFCLARNQSEGFFVSFPFLIALT